MSSLINLTKPVLSSPFSPPPPTAVVAQPPTIVAAQPPQSGHPTPSPGATHSTRTQPTWLHPSEATTTTTPRATTTTTPTATSRTATLDDNNSNIHYPSDRPQQSLITSTQACKTIGEIDS